jgi:hypothetical protein
MNLGKLLGAGKSFLGGCKVVAYRQDKRVYLPKFNSEKNPFVTRAAEKPAATVAEPRLSKATAPATAPAPMAAPVMAPAQKAPVFAVQKPQATSRWTEKFNLFRAPEPAPAPMVNAVQSELSLDAVKVLHNDLSDADVEVVPVKSRTAAPVEAPRLLPSRGSLEFFGERQLETA